MNWSFLEAEVTRRWLLSQTAGLLLLVAAVVLAVELIGASLLCAADDANSCGSTRELTCWQPQHGATGITISITAGCSSRTVTETRITFTLARSASDRRVSLPTAASLTHSLRADDVFSTCCRSVSLPSGFVIDEFLADRCWTASLTAYIAQDISAPTTPA